MSEIKGTRWPRGLGIKAGRALSDAERALLQIQATAAVNDWDCISKLRAARLGLNKLARHISHIIAELEEPRG